MSYNIYPDPPAYRRDSTGTNVGQEGGPGYDTAGHRAIARITQLNNQQLADGNGINPLAAPPIAAGIATTAMGALQLTQFGMAIPTIMIHPVLGRPV